MAESPNNDSCRALLDPHDEHGRRRTALLQAAFDVVAEVGFQGLRTRAVANRAGVNIAPCTITSPPSRTSSKDWTS